MLGLILTETDSFEIACYHYNDASFLIRFAQNTESIQEDNHYATRVACCVIHFTEDGQAKTAVWKIVSYWQISNS